MLGQQHESAARAAAQRLHGGGRRRRARRHRRLFPPAARAPTCSCCTTARAAPSRTPTCSAPSWCCPALLALQRVLAGRLGRRRCVPAAVLLHPARRRCLLSFSRAAWGQFAFAARHAHGARLHHHALDARARCASCCSRSLGVVALAAFIAALLSIDQVAELFEERASLDQSYDVGHRAASAATSSACCWRSTIRSASGRCSSSRYLPRGPAQLLPQRLHVGRLARRLQLSGPGRDDAGVRAALRVRRTPWRRPISRSTPPSSALAAESVIIDTDHWRHYFLLLGVLWGLMAASRAYLRAPAARLARRQAIAPARAPALAPSSAAA